MKDNLFEMLFHLFEKSLNQLQKNCQLIDKKSADQLNESERSHSEEQSFHIKSAQDNSTRIFTYEEQMRLTKVSYQFLARMKLWGVIDTDALELIINQLLCSDSRVITIEETKWTTRNVLASNLNEKELTFLDLVLYQAEDELTAH